MRLLTDNNRNTKRTVHFFKILFQKTQEVLVLVRTTSQVLRVLSRTSLERNYINDTIEYQPCP